MVSPQLLTFPVALPSGAVCHVRADVWQRRPSAARTVVCVHGLTRNRHDFDVLAHALSTDYRVICLDMPGRGESDWLENPAEYHYPNYVSAVMQVLAQLGLAQVDWIGTSMGGIIGLMLANASPGLLRSLVLNDIGALVPAAGLRRIMAYVGVNTHFATRMQAEAALRETLKPFGLQNEQQWRQLLTTSIRELADGTACLAYDPAIHISLPKGDAIADVNLWPLWEAVKPVPVLLLRGAESDILTVPTAREMHATHTHLTYHEIPGTGHAPALVAQEQVDAIRLWLSEIR